MCTLNRLFGVTSTIPVPVTAIDVLPIGTNDNKIKAYPFTPLYFINSVYSTRKLIEKQNLTTNH